MSTPPKSLNQKLVSRLKSSKRVVEVGSDSGVSALALAQNPGLSWHRVSESLEGLPQDCDVVLLMAVLGECEHPKVLLKRLREELPAHCRLLVVVENHSHVSVLERLLLGDFSKSERSFSASSICRLLLDGGWLPNLSDHLVSGRVEPELMKALVQVAGLVSVSEKGAHRNLMLSHFVFECTQAPQVKLEVPLSLSVIVPVTNPLQYQMNVMSSPGFQEVDAEFLSIQGAENAAEAFEAGANAASGEWLVFCHQDVYFPKGSGGALALLLSGIPAALAPKILLGFAGIGMNSESEYRKAGLVVDRLNRFSYPPTAHASSLDEFAVVMHRDSLHKLDPDLGWHLWATDLCLQAAQRSEALSVAITRIPIFHNSLSDRLLPAEFWASAKRLREKYPHLRSILTLCGEICRAA